MAELRSEVAATAANATALANQATSNAGNSAPANANLTPAQRARATIEALGRDLFDKHVLDPYLQFASPEDEEAYRKREKERQEAYERALALHTPEGDHLALQLQKAQIADAKAHGADRSPDIAGMQLRAREATADLLPATLQPDGPPPEPNAPAAKSTPNADASNGLGDIFASLKAAGVTTPAIQSNDAGHGVEVALANGRGQAGPVRLG